MSEVRQRFRVTGAVQCVGFRAATQAEAQHLGLVGWVRNRTDGSVEAEAQGEEDQVAALAAWLETGPPAAKVQSVDSETRAPEPGTGVFDLRPTL